MSGSLDGSPSEFDGLRQRQVCELLRVLSEAELATKEHIRRRYAEREARFDETLAFLLEVRAVEEAGALICPALALAAISPDDYVKVSEATLRLLMNHDTRYRREVCDYLARFRVAGGAVVYRPLHTRSSAESGVRNFLMDLGVVTYDGNAGEYLLPPTHSALYAQARYPHRAITLAELKARLLAKEKLGLDAEKAVLVYERQRVGHHFEREVRHVATQDVAAGYDVLSVTVQDDGETTPRYIEVKAVPRDTYRFLWTANELTMAEAFGPRYYLYLVPVGSDGRLDLSRVRIVSDPVAAVLGVQSEWDVQRDGVRCSLATPRRGTTHSDEAAI